MRAVEEWPELDHQLEVETEIDVALEQRGGLYICRTAEALAQRAADLATVRARHNGPYHYEILDGDAIRKMVPEIGPDVAGASYSKYDGQSNPIRLLQALHRGYARRGGRYAADNGVIGIERKEDKFILATARGQVVARRIALASGLGNALLGEMLGVTIPVKPVRGQI